MRKRAVPVARRAVAALRGFDSPQLVIGAGALMIVAQLAFRAWALYPSWFYVDDYNLLLDAQGEHLDAGYLLDPYNSHLMPGGRLIAWLVADSGQLNWGLAATLTLVAQAVAGVAALWMLTTLFGARWAVLAPLSLYLTSAMTVPAMMWWTASLNQVPLQCAFFLAVCTWVRYLRTGRRRWLLATTAAVSLGLFFYVKALLIFPVLAFITLAYFASGSSLQRVRGAIRRFWPAVVVGGATVAAYLAYYVSHVEEPFTETSASLIGRLADSMLGTAFISAVVGGPWRWAPNALPNAFADPPAWTLHIAWVLVVLIVLYGALRRTGSLRAWVLLLGYLVGLLVLLLNSRAPVYGSNIGLQYRYLTDAACAVALCLGLAFLPICGAEQASRPRDEPLLRLRVPTWGAAALVAVICASGVLSTVRYVGYWHSDNASDAFVHNLQADLRAQGEVDLADQTVPEAVIPGIFAPDNAVHRVTSLVSNRVSFPDASPRLAVVGEDGTLHSALIDEAITSRKGRIPDCGWLVNDDDSGRTIPLTGSAFLWEWWIRIGYLASQDSTVDVIAGSSHVTTTVDAGLNSLYVKVKGTFNSIHITGLDPGTTMCVDTVEVGQPVPGRRLD